MNDLPAEMDTDDQFLMILARNLIDSCSPNGLNYSLIKNHLENALKKPVNTIISILSNDSNNYVYQKQIDSIKILPFRQLAEEIVKFKKRSTPLVTRTLGNAAPIESENLQKLNSKLYSLQETILNAARTSKSPQVKALYNSIKQNGSEIEIDTFKDLLTLIIKEGENNAKSRMANLWSNIRQEVNESHEIDESISIIEYENSIVQTVQSLKEQIDHTTIKSLKTDSMQNQLISTLQSQIEDLKAAVNFRKETENFEREINKHFENIENSLNSSKYDELYENYKQTFRKIEELSNSKNQLVLKNGNLETQNFHFQQKVSDLTDEINRLKKTIQEMQNKK